MKTFTKILMAIVAGMFVFSCVTDTTEDLGVQLGNAGQTVIDLSLEESRTHIGGKNGDEYPLYWSEGDKIAVNGIVSEALSSAFHGKQNAQFSVSGELGYPRDIVYPAPAEAVTATEGKRAVTFLEVQNYTAGTFAEGSTPMYAQIKADGYGATLKHLAGVLRIAPKGEGVTLISMSIEAENGKLAGNFDLDCATGTLTPQVSATNNISVAFGNAGLALGADETPIYVGVPAGEYGTISVTLYTATDSMTLSFDTTGYKSVRAGFIREFTPFNYVANNIDSDTFLIYDEATLRSFAEKAADFAPYTKAKVTASIDMTGKEWNSISGFGEYEFDGGNKAIKGLNAPLFDTTATTLRNVRLTEIDMTVSGADAAALACCISSENAVVENCYVQGKLTIDAASPVAIHDSALHYASIIGYSLSTQEFTNLTADVEIVAKGTYGATQTRFGGVVCRHMGKLSNSTKLGSTTFSGNIDDTPIMAGITHLSEGGLENCHNKGVLTVEGTLGKNLLMSGITNYGQGTIKNCSNSGDITIATDVPEIIFISGCVARTNNVITVEKCNNYGKITLSGSANQGRLAGILEEDYNYNATFTDCHNYGDIIIDKGASLTGSLVIGGLLGYRNDAKVITFTNCSNNANLTIKSGATIGGNLQIGGMASYLAASGSTLTLASCTNNGSINLESGANLAAVYMGGFSAYKANAGKLTIDNSTNKAAMNYSATSSGAVLIAGILASYTTSAATLGVKHTVANEGTITVGGSAKGNIRIGGIIGAFAQTWASESSGATIHNKGAINVSMVNNATPSATSFLVGGIMGAMGQSNPGGVTWYSEGDITVTSSNVHVGGLVGSQTGSGTKDVSNAYCFCNLKATNASGVGMLTGAARSKLMKSCAFGGTIWKSGMTEALTLNIENFHTYAYNSAEERETIITTDSIGYISSIDDMPKYALPSKINSVDELLAFAANPTTGDITLTADIDLTDIAWTPIENFSGTFDGGNNKIIGLKAPLFGSTAAAICLQNIHLTNVNITEEDETISYLGALANHIESSSAIIRNCSAEGTIAINFQTRSTGTYYVGGLVGRTTTTKKISGLVSKVDVTTEGDLFALYLGGCVGSAPYAVVDNCQNYGTKTLNGLYGGSQLVGGIVSTCAGVTNCTNGSEKTGEKQLLGKITYNGEHYGTATRYIDLAGVCAFTNATASIGEGCKNYGAIDCGGSVISGSKTMLRVAGVFTNAERISNGAVRRCENYGNITISHKNPGTTNSMVSGVCGVISIGLSMNELSDLHNYGNITVTKEASFNNNLLLGGIMNVFDNPRTYKNLYNHGNITLEDFTIGGDLYMGGVTGRARTDAAGTFEGTLGNEGTISVATNVTGAVAIGGVLGLYNSPNVNTNTINIGDINVTGTFNGVVYIGGICAGSSSAGSITNAKCYCNIYSSNYPAGFIFGTERSTTCKAINCAVGGKIATTTTKYEDSDGIEVFAPLWVELSDTNFFDYMYGGTTDWTGVENYDGCSFLSVVPEV